MPEEEPFDLCAWVGRVWLSKAAALRSRRHRGDKACSPLRVSPVRVSPAQAKALLEHHQGRLEYYFLRRQVEDRGDSASNIP